MNTTYTPPLEEQLFLLDKVMDWQRLFALPAFSHVDADLATAVLAAGAKYATEVLAPINQTGDEKGCSLKDGQVTMPDEFNAAYKKFVDGGWAGLDLPVQYGGQNLPLSIQVAFAEMINGACLSFGMLPVMLRAAAWLLLEHGDKDLVDKIVPNLVSGKWGATICITEPEAGSDVGRIRSKAVSLEDGTFKITGTKIFISYGDQDYTDQIIHMVLARTDYAPPGTQGISLFVVPKRKFQDGELNGVSVSRIEKKMGLKASPTCVLDLQDAVAYRVGPEYHGLKCMFTMVNLMRLEVSIQGPALASAATSKALNYAAERPQGGKPDEPAVNIIEHADVRRMLFVMRTRTEAMRALVYEAAFNLDLARAAEEEQLRNDAQSLADFLLPVCKACGSETGFDVANMAIQVFGGHGYITEAGLEQYVRDIRIAAIYEGTNGIQALDLVTRKLLKDSCRRYKLFIGRINDDIHRYSGIKHLEDIHLAVLEGRECLDRCTDYLIDTGKTAIRNVEVSATDYLQLCGLVGGAWMWLRMAANITEDSPRYQLKQSCAGFYARYLMPESLTLENKIHMGSRIVDSVESETMINI